MTPEVLEVIVHMSAQPDTIFPFFTDPVRYAQWMGTDVELEAKPGGLYRVRMREGVEVSGAFEEVQPPHRLVLPGGGTATRPCPRDPPASKSL